MPLTPLQEKQVHNAIFAGHKIEAIKIYREANNCGLKEAKEDVESLEAQLRRENAHRFEKAEVKGGCFGVLVFCASLGALAGYVLR